MFLRKVFLYLGKASLRIWMSAYEFQTCNLRMRKADRLWLYYDAIRQANNDSFNTANHKVSKVIYHNVQQLVQGQISEWLKGRRGEEAYWFNLTEEFASLTL